ncbi:uncharacterized protein N7515_003201 [Penicillium bovifimosum]|uniref:alpha,alpha-trehalose-phosphate synthase (UDP-forming) n=1 Tax=Penicillium bovifimosum TaxID=126998 RepID=A0A9W9H4K7_9EURO|nr:uncharacterized protein N7515_003201 [Penicillium bovifimosum]KAJ5138353.1 hypothetical protein N7515_003201 [Penicillium bovifimosum]
MPSIEEPKQNEARLLLVSNRLPITIKRSEDGKYDFSMSSGGLVSGLSGLSKSTTFQWYGWPGLEVPEPEIPVVKQRLKDEYGAVPVFIDDELADRHYNGFSNSILWPLFHYHPGEITFDESAWEAYKEANRLFARAISKEVQDGDLIWVHDYHLMLLPEMLREEIGDSKKNVKIGFFLHTPFPSSEIYRILPVRNELLLGVLHCDLIGFHTYDYTRHFLSSCSRLLGLATTPNGIEFQGKIITCGAFPIGIDPEKFKEGLKKEKVQKRIAMLEQKFQGVKLMVGVDRLDYIKGVPQKLHALEVFLSDHPEWVGKVVLVQVAVPSRQDVEEYQNLRAVVNELVGRINGKFGTIEFQPIHFLHKSVNFDELIALYAVSDACIVSSTRDGMNLVAYEYIATQQKRHGVLVLSEFAGAAQSLNGSIIVNPWNTEELAGAYQEAVTMSDEQRALNFAKLDRYVSKYTSAFWGQSFVTELTRISAHAADKFQSKKLTVHANNANMLPREISKSQLQTSQAHNHSGVVTITTNPCLHHLLESPIISNFLFKSHQRSENPPTKPTMSRSTLLRATMPLRAALTPLSLTRPSILQSTTFLRITTPLRSITTTPTTPESTAQGTDTRAPSRLRNYASTLKTGTVVSVGRMDRTVRVCHRHTAWDRHIRKYYPQETHYLVSDPRNSLREGDVIEFSSGAPKSRHVRHVVERIVTPFGVGINERPAVMSKEEREAEREERWAKKYLRRESRRLGREVDLEVEAKKAGVYLGANWWVKETSDARLIHRIHEGKERVGRVKGIVQERT